MMYWRRANAPAPLALDLSSAAVHLMGRTGECWEVLGTAPLDAEFSERIDALRIEALARGRGPVPVDLWLPGDQLVIRHDDLPPGERGRAEALRLLAADSGLRPHELFVAFSPAQPGRPACALAVPTRIVAEAREYAERWGFVPGRVTTRPDTVPFGPAGPPLEPPRRFPRAMRAARNTGLSAAAAVLMGVAAWGAWQMLPGPAPAIMPGTPPVLAIAIVDVGAPGLRRAPFTRVRRDPAPALASLRPQAGGPAPLGPVAAPAVGLAPGLAQPAPGVPMHVGPAPAMPGLFRPARLDRTVAAADRLDPAALVGSMHRLRTELASRSASWHFEPLSIAGVAALAAAEVPVMPDPEARTAGMPFAPDARIVLAAATTAPRTVPGAPLPRPERAAAAGPETRPGEPDPAPPAAEQALDAPEGPGTASAAEPETDAADPRPALSAEPPRPAPPRPETASAQGPGTEAADPGPTPLAVEPSPPVPDAPSRRETASAAEPAASAPASALAAIAAPRPLARPENRARQLMLAAAPRAFDGDPSPARVGQAASRHGLALDSTSLIGVLDAKSGRQALLRTPAGQFLKVARGDTVDGWRVSAINREAVRLTRGGQNRTLLLVVR